MAKPKSKLKVSYPDDNDRTHSSCSLNSSTESQSEKSLLTVNTDALRHSSEVLKRQRHFQEFRRIYCSRQNHHKNKDKHASKKHDTPSRWSDAVSTFKRKESTDKVQKIPLRRMTSSRINRIRSEKIYIEKLLNKFQKPTSGNKSSSDSIKLMYSTFCSVGTDDRNKNNLKEHSYGKSYKYDIRDGERRHRSAEGTTRYDYKREHNKERDRSRSAQDDDRNINEIQNKHERHSRHRYRSNIDQDEDEAEREYRGHRRHRRSSVDEEQKSPPLEEYYQKHGHHEKDSNREHNRHRESAEVDNDNDKRERRRRIYENYEKYKYERDHRHRSRDKYYDDEEERPHHHRREILDKYDKRENVSKYNDLDNHGKYENYDKYDKYKYDREHRHRRYDSPDEKLKEQNSHDSRHRSRTSRHSRYPDDEDYEMIQRLERYILEKKIGTTMHKSHKSKYDEDAHYYLYNTKGNIKRVPSTEHLALGNRKSSYTSNQDVYERRSLNDSFNKPKEDDEIESPIFKKFSKESKYEENNAKIAILGKVEEEVSKKDLVVKTCSSDQDNEEQSERQPTLTNSQKLLIEQQVQCVQVEKKSQAIETKMIPGITPLKPTKQKITSKKDINSNKSSKIEYANSSTSGTKTSLSTQPLKTRKRQIQIKTGSSDAIKMNSLKNKSSTKTDNKSKVIKNRSQTVTLKAPKKQSTPKIDTSSSVLSTLSQMEEKTLKTLEALKDAEKIIISEKLGKIEPPSHESFIQEEIERHLKRIEEITKKTDPKKYETLRNKHDEVDSQELTPEKISSYHEQCQQVLECKLLILKLRELEKLQNAQNENYVVDRNEENNVSDKNTRQEKGSNLRESSTERNIPENAENLTNVVKDKISPNASDRYTKLKHHDVDDNDRENYKKREIEKVRQKYKTGDMKRNNESNVAEKRIKWKGVDGEKEDSHWLDIRKEDIIIDKGFNWNGLANDGSENNLDWVVDENNENQDCKVSKKDLRCDKKSLDHKDTIQEECTDECNAKVYDLKDENKEGITVGEELETCRAKLVEEIREIIEEPIASLKSESTSRVISSRLASKAGLHSKHQIGSTSATITSRRDSSKSRLPIRIDSKNACPVEKPEVKPEEVAEKIINIYRVHAYENEELLEKLKKVVDLQKTPSPRLSVINQKQNKPSAFQKVKKMIKGDKKKENKKTTKPPVSKRQVSPKKEIKKDKTAQVSPDEETLLEAINLFNIHKSTLSIVHGEIKQLEHKISVLLEKREKSKRKKSKIPRRIIHNNQ